MARQGIKARWQRMARQGTQGHKARHAIIIGKASARQGRKASAIAIGIIGMPLSARYRQGMPSARQGTQGRKASAGRSSRTQDGRKQQSGAV